MAAAQDLSSGLPGPENGGLTGTLLAARYRLIGLVKAGGMGAVYQAEDIKLGRRVAVKILSPQFTQQPDMVRRFFREAKAPSFAQHPNIVEYLDFDQIANGVAYLVMEYLQGDDLERVLKRRGPLSWPELAPLMLQSCRALSASHAAGIIHRDIKPSNFILLDRSFDEDPPLIKLIDFGIAKFTEGSRLHSHTEVTEHLMGSERFIAPEMYALVPANPRTDIYALGITMFRLLTGKYPEASGGYDMLPPSALRPDADIPPEADALILRAIHVNPYARFEAMAELEAEIAGYLRRPELRIDPGPPPIAPSGTTGPSPIVHEPSSATIVVRRSRIWQVVVFTAIAWLVTIVALFTSRQATPELLQDRPEAIAGVSQFAPPTDPSPAKMTTPPIAPQPTPTPTPHSTETEATSPPVIPSQLPTYPPEPEPQPAVNPKPDAPPLDMTHVDRELRKLDPAVSKCGLDGGLWRNMKLDVAVRIDRAGRASATVKNAGKNAYADCITRQFKRLKFGPSAAGGKTTIEYTI